MHLVCLKRGFILVSGVCRNYESVTIHWRQVWRELKCSLFTNKTRSNMKQKHGVAWTQKREHWHRRDSYQPWLQWNMTRTNPKRDREVKKTPMYFKSKGEKTHEIKYYRYVIFTIIWIYIGNIDRMHSIFLKQIHIFIFSPKNYIKDNFLKLWMKNIPSEINIKIE